MNTNTPAPAGVVSSTEFGQVLFEVWQKTDRAELDGEHTLCWHEMTDEYRDAWRAVAAEAKAALTLPNTRSPSYARQRSSDNLASQTTRSESNECRL